MKKFFVFLVVVAILAGLVAGGASILKNRGNVPAVKGEALPTVEPTMDLQSQIDAAVAEALAALQPTAMPTVEPTVEATAEVVDIDALVAQAVAEALAAQQQPTQEAPASVVETAVVCDCSLCVTAEPEVEKTEEEAAVVVEDKDVFKVGEIYSAVVNMPVFTGTTYDGSGVIYTIEPEMAVIQKNTQVYGKPAQPQFSLNGDLVGYRMLGFIPEYYSLQEMKYQYVVESTMTIQELIEAVTVRNDNGGFSLRAEANKGQRPIVKLWLSEKESEFWTICQRVDGTFVVLMRTAAATSAPRKAVVVETGGNGGGEHHEEHHDPKPGPKNEPDPQYDPIILPWDNDPAPQPSGNEPNPQYDDVKLPWD